MRNRDVTRQVPLYERELTTIGPDGDTGGVKPPDAVRSRTDRRHTSTAVPRRCGGTSQPSPGRGKALGYGTGLFGSSGAGPSRAWYGLVRARIAVSVPRRCPCRVGRGTSRSKNGRELRRSHIATGSYSSDIATVETGSPSGTAPTDCCIICRDRLDGLPPGVVQIEPDGEIRRRRARAAPRRGAASGRRGCGARSALSRA